MSDYVDPLDSPNWSLKTTVDKVLWHITPASLGHIMPSRPHLVGPSVQSSTFRFHFNGYASSLSWTLPSIPGILFLLVSCIRVLCLPQPGPLFHSAIKPWTSNGSWMWGLLALLHNILKCIHGSYFYSRVLNCSRTSWFLVWFGFNIFVPHRWKVLICVPIFLLSWPGTVPASQGTKIN